MSKTKTKKPKKPRRQHFGAKWRLLMIPDSTPPKVDEFVLEDLLHVEMMNDTEYFVQIGDYKFSCWRSNQRTTWTHVLLTEGPKPIPDDTPDMCDKCGR